jgi:thermostable 8-oxoguanine DNA glycosylase
MGAIGDVAVLDAHVTAYLSIRGVGQSYHHPPRAMKEYLALETAFIDYSRWLGVDPHLLDVSIWLVMREVRRSGNGISPVGIRRD